MRENNKLITVWKLFSNFFKLNYNNFILNNYLLKFANNNFDKEKENTENYENNQSENPSSLNSSEIANDPNSQIKQSDKNSLNSLQNSNHSHDQKIRPNNPFASPFFKQGLRDPYGNVYIEDIKPDFNDLVLKSQIKKMRHVSIGTIVCFFVWVIFLILFAVIKSALFFSYFSTALDSFLNDPEESSLPDPSVVIWSWIALGLFVFSWAAGIIVCGIIGSIRLGKLGQKDYVFSNLKMQYMIGIFVPVFQLYSAFKVLSFINRKYAPFLKKEKKIIS